jgi:hypothetical protein
LGDVDFYTVHVISKEDRPSVLPELLVFKKIGVKIYRNRI